MEVLAVEPSWCLLSVISVVCAVRSISGTFQHLWQPFVLRVQACIAEIDSTAVAFRPSVDPIMTVAVPYKILSSKLRPSRFPQRQVIIRPWQQKCPQCSNALNVKD